MLPVGSLVGDGATGVGFIAASIAVCGFLGQIKPALAHDDDQAIRAATVIGGIAGLVFAVGTILISTCGNVLSVLT